MDAGPARRSDAGARLRAHLRWDAMLLACPSCSASYRLADDALGGGRTVRCARCRTQWFVEGRLQPVESLDDAAPLEAVDSVEWAAAMPDQTEAVEPEHGDNEAAVPLARSRMRLRLPKPWRARPPAPAPRPAMRKPRSPSRRIRPAAALAVVGAIALVAVVGARADIVSRVPALASLYSAVGLEVNVRGLAIADVRSVETIEEGVPILLVTGSISNVSQANVDLPRLRLAVRAGDGRELYAWTTVAGRTKLAPGETTPFRARLASPPAEGRAIAVRFLARQDLAAQASR
jgi:predicted Zn finger-like uncharacterized protein